MRGILPEVEGVIVGYYTPAGGDLEPESGASRLPQGAPSHVPTAGRDGESGNGNREEGWQDPVSRPIRP